MKKDLKSGFTLIELMVVIAIIGILSSVVLNGLGGTKEHTRDVIRAGDLKSLGQAAEVYFSEHNAQFPSTETWITDLNPYFSNDAIPKDPRTHADYSYEATVSPKGYCLGAVMETEAMHNTETCDSGNDDDNYKIKGP